MAREKLSTVESLQNISQILHLAHHRNTNQHRLSKWYKSFSQLRRHIAKLILELETLETAISMCTKSGATVAENKYVVNAQVKVEQRGEFLREILIPKCFVAFGNLVADNQYAVLGLMLMGALASVKSNVEMLPNSRRGEDTPDQDIGKIEENFMNESLADQEKDVGEVISRQQFQTRTKSSIREANDKMSIKVSASSKRKNRQTWGTQDITVSKLNSPTKVRNKKRKKADIFDEIFDAIV